MPVRQFKQKASTEHEVLADELATEWLALQSSNAEPVILEQSLPGHGLAYVYVVWSKWGSLSGAERSEIIMEAAEKKFPPEQLVKILTAMGLTPTEADQMGIEWR